MARKWDDECECGHTRYSHECDYANHITKLEECKKCSCQIFIFKQTRKSD